MFRYYLRGIKRIKEATTKVLKSPQNIVISKKYSIEQKTVITSYIYFLSLKIHKTRQFKKTLNKIIIFTSLFHTLVTFLGFSPNTTAASPSYSSINSSIAVQIKV